MATLIQPYSLAKHTITYFQVAVTFLFQIFFRIYYDYRADFNGSIDASKRYIIAANHERMLDVFAIFSALSLQDRRAMMPTKCMIWPKLYDTWWLKPILFLLGSFPAHNKDHEHFFAGVEGSVHFLENGYNLFIFPEGKRTQARMPRAHGGINRILAGYPEAQLLIAHIQWQDRKLRVTLREAGTPSIYHSPEQIMQAIYTL